MERKEQEIFFFVGILEDIVESDDESDDDFALQKVILIKKSIVARVPRIRCKNYIEKVVWKYTDDEFKSHFR